MASVSPTRPSRRAAARKKVVVDDSDQEELHGPSRPEPMDEEDFTPAPQRSPRRQTRRKTTEVSRTPPAAGRVRRTRKTDGIEPPQGLNHEEAGILPPEPVSPSKQPSPRKRKSAPATRKGRTSVSAEPVPLMPTPRVSATPDISQLHGTPLADITDATVNEQVAPAGSQNAYLPVKPLDTVMERPMDIVVRSRALAVPQVQNESGPSSRTVIQYLVLTNFKSYAGRQEVGPFHASFSSVVGPNGSGKSNVIDSLLFVFGFRASKMRQGKISALIHNSAAFPNLDYCEVEVHFQEVVDLVSLPVDEGVCMKADFELSPEASMKLYLAQRLLFLAKRLRAMQASIISTLKSQTLLLSQHC